MRVSKWVNRSFQKEKKQTIVFLEKILEIFGGGLENLASDTLKLNPALGKKFFSIIHTPIN